MPKMVAAQMLSSKQCHTYEIVSGREGRGRRSGRGKRRRKGKGEVKEREGKHTCMVVVIPTQQQLCAITLATKHALAYRTIREKIFLFFGERSWRW
jgi:hypothetical protein